MNLKKNLVFLGMMGSGKSSIGHLVSKKLNLKFIDIDNEIENEMRMKILDIFKKKGEIFFRNLEKEISLKVLKNNNVVISLGGGGFINNQVRKVILTNHLSFWLHWNLEILLKRIKNSRKRPLAFNSTDQELKNLIKKRSIIYSKAKFKINCNNQSKNEIVKIVKKIYELN
jgi:shikimate kinase